MCGHKYLSDPSPPKWAPNPLSSVSYLLKINVIPAS